MVIVWTVPLNLYQLCHRGSIVAALKRGVGRVVGPMPSFDDDDGSGAAVIATGSFATADTDRPKTRRRRTNATVCQFAHPPERGRRLRRGVASLLIPRNGPTRTVRRQSDSSRAERVVTLAQLSFLLHETQLNDDVVWAHRVPACSARLRPFQGDRR